MRIAISSLVCVLACEAAAFQTSRSPASTASPRDQPSVVDRFLTAADVPLTGYRAIRTLEASTRGGQMHARMTARTSFDAATGFRYEVIEESGSSVIRSKVLKAALDAERSLVSSGEVSKGALTRANYDFAVGAEADAREVWVAVHPKRRDTMLVDGRILLTRDIGDLVRIEGQLSKAPSFWTRRVDVVRHYARIGGVRVPTLMQSTARVLIVGTSNFSMTYDYEAINGKAIAPRERPRAATSPAP